MKPRGGRGQGRGSEAAAQLVASRNVLAPFVGLRRSRDLLQASGRKSNKHGSISDAETTGFKNSART